MHRMLLTAWAGVMMLAVTAGAHEFRPGALTLLGGPGGDFGVVWRPPSTDPDAPDVFPRFPDHCRRYGREVPVTETTSRWTIRCGAAGLRGHTLAVAGLAETEGDVVLRIEWAVGEPTMAVLRAATPTFRVPAVGGFGDRVWDVVRGYAVLGIEHIWIGTDHLLFVLGLFLLVPSLGALLATVTAFTCAHTLSLAVSALEVVAVPSAPVEAVIALSVLLLATELARPSDRPPTATQRWPWVVAAIFGLIHGLGFAGALAEIGLPPGQVLSALVGFNVGVEIGQILFLGCLALLARAVRPLVSAWPPLRWAPVYAMGAAASTWLIVRLGQLGA